MRLGKTVAVVVAAAFGAAGTASAASDYFLKIEGVQGESVAGETIEVQSFSWGASNPSTVGSGGLSAGRVAAPRDAASGQATGRRQATAAEEPSSGPQVGQIATFSVAFRESPTRASTGSLARACATGKHIPNAVLSVRGVSYTLSDVVVSSCAAEGEMRRTEFRGHVTLIK